MTQGIISFHLKIYEQLRVMDNMNDFGSWDQDAKCFEHLRLVDDMNNSRSWALGSRIYE